MKLKNIIKLAFLIAFFVGILSGEWYLLHPPTRPAPSPAAVADELFGWKFPIAKFPITGSDGNLIAYSSIRDPGGIPRGLPVRIKIPAIGVDSAIEDALITPDGRMDVPAGSVNVAWFSLGPHPGQVGSAVIGGHFGITNGVPFVFYNLDKLKTGDKIYIVDDSDNTLAFVVRSTKSFDRNGDSTTVFTSHDGLAHLNLITCEGIWNQVNGTYPQRLVIFTDAIPSEGAVQVKSKTVAKPKPALPATDVVVPTPSPTPSPSPSPLLQPTPDTSSNVVQLQTLSLFSQLQQLPFVNVLYGDLVSGLVSTVLIISIFFLIFKVIRK